MTSAPVKGVGSLMNFVGGKNLTQTGGTDPVSSFGDVMSKTQNSSVKTEEQNQPAVKSNDTAAKDAYESRRDAVKDAQATNKAVKTDGRKQEQCEAVEEAGKELVKDIAEELGVSEEEVVKAMEELGLSVYSLFDSANLTQLVLALSGNTDVSALLTDEGLFGKLQELLQMAADAKSGLLQEMNVNPDEFQTMLEELQKAAQEAKAADVSLVQQADAEVATQEEGPQITVEVHTGGETVKLATDENGNAVKALGTVSQETSKTDAEQNGHGDKEGNGQFDNNANSGNALIDAAMQNKAQVQDVAGEQNGAFFNSQTQDIMNQIMDYMRIQLKPGMDQLQMQLHPESLGTVHVQLTNKGGEITAQFQVQNETVKAAIESQIVELKESLRDQGVKVEAVEVTVESNGFESNLWQGQRGEENTASQNGKKTPRRINLNELDALFEEQATEEEILNAKVMEMNGSTVDYTA